MCARKLKNKAVRTKKFYHQNCNVTFLNQFEYGLIIYHSIFSSLRKRYRKIITVTCFKIKTKPNEKKTLNVIFFSKLGSAQMF